MAINNYEVISQEPYREIPEEILQAAFGPGGTSNPQQYTTIDQCLLNYIWKPITLKHINLTVGRDKLIVLQPNWRLRTRPVPYDPLMSTLYHTGFYQIPPEAREYSHIVNVECITDRYPASSLGFAGGVGANGLLGNTMAGLAQAAVATRTYASSAIVPEVTRVGPDMVEVTPDEYVCGTLDLRCTLGYNAELTNADNTLVDAARDLFLADVKVFLYTNMTIKIDKAAVVGGFEIGTFRSTLDEYAGAREERKALLETLRGQSYTDPKLFRRMVSNLL